MLQPKFTVGRSDRLYITEKYLCNGHWLVTRDCAANIMGPKALKPLLSVQHGTYFDGLSGGKSKDETPDTAQAIPKRDGYELLELDPVGVEFKNSDWIGAYVFQGKGFRVGVAPQYVPLLRMGRAFAKDHTGPIIVLGGDSLNDELVAVVMPMRLSVNNARV